jgi:single-strand DNA-binding protein
VAIDVTLSDARLAFDPELKFLTSGTAAMKARAAVTRRYQDKGSGEWKDGNTTWLDLLAYGTLAQEAAEHLRKGDLVTGSGTFEIREYERGDGTKGFAHEVTLRHLGRDLVRAKKDESRQSPPKAEYTDPPF